ncbi:DEAD-box ATP-dependent RNA helicase [Striga asiatica]|uniref:DEAD-box ATP-dependent RNA helicase n=1 Tax=Striga asiatica TaxID=4170 RepID=A0A5A7PJA9_STRAF|nr:DEAD-box ATP-dependent RNA helicase [Striga asiatica]
MGLLFIRSSSPSSNRLVLNALSHFLWRKPPFPYAKEYPQPRPSPAFGLTRGFHSGLAMRAGCTVADCSDAEDAKSSDEGLEISKLGISALASRGTQKLFPIQKAVLELAMQGHNMIGRSGRDPLASWDVAIARQMSTLDRGADVVVGTPGRVLDLITCGALNVSKVQYVVLDEADQILNVGFAYDLGDVESSAASDAIEEQTHQHIDARSKARFVFK